MPPAFAMPYLRTGKQWTLRARARLALLTPSRPGTTPPGFILGCGRSGTTLLGRMFVEHPHVTYLFEPYHAWRVIDARTDVTGLHGSALDARYFLDAEDHTDRAQRRFDALIAGAARPGNRVIEKMPHNVARIGWLESMTTNAAYLHIVRNGLAVARSIERLATNPTYKMAFRQSYNQWWGERDARWTHLRAGSVARGYFPAEVGQITTHAQRGAYEWIASLSEADRWRDTLGDRMIDVSYSDLTSDPATQLDRICAHFDLDAPDDWRTKAIDMVRAEQLPDDMTLDLPPEMTDAFNAYQDRFGFQGHARRLDA